MSSENEEQKPVSQTLCGALQKEANCKCLVLSVLIYGCLAAVTWCRCANVTKIVINFSTFPIKSTKHVSPCDDGYIYIPVAFMGMLYLVYLVECYHSPIRIDLLHAEGQNVVLAKLTQLKLAQPTIWWKAISYHYVRRKRQVMRYRNGDNFTTTQVYYERVNSHAATSFYFYDYCGSKDISKELVLDPKIPITKITLSKGFAFSNVRSATEFEEARSRFFAEQEFRDDYMEMREGLDLGSNFSPMTLVAVLGNPWFTRSYVYWCLSALLLSWPLRIIIECNTQYVDYQVTKLFGVNYDTPTNIQIHTSASQLSAPGSYMLAPSYSEALLMEPSGPRATTASAGATPMGEQDVVPSYSEALLYERAAAELQPPKYQAAACECPCHGLREFVSQDSVWRGSGISVAMGGVDEPAGAAGSNDRRSMSADQTSPSDARICDNCLSDGRRDRTSTTTTPLSSSCRELGVDSSGQPKPPLDRRRVITREYSEPDLRRSAEFLVDGFARTNGRSLENIIESEETDTNPRAPEPARNNTGAIPKRNQPTLTVNPLAEEEEEGDEASKQQRLPSSRSTYFCLRSILKQNRRRFTLVTPEELQCLTQGGANDNRQPEPCNCDGCRTDVPCRPDTLRIDKRLRPVSCQSLSSTRNGSRTLIFASPIQSVCPLDPFGGRDVVQGTENPPGYEEALNLPPVLSRLRRSTGESTVQVASTSSTSTTTPTASGSRPWNKRVVGNTDPQNVPPQSSSAGTSRLLSSTQSGSSETAISLPSYNGLTVPPDSRNQGVGNSTDETSPFLGHDELAAAATPSPSSTNGVGASTSAVKSRSRLTRSLTERRITPSARRQDQALRKSFTERIDTGLRIPGIKRMNINIETSL